MAFNVTRILWEAGAYEAAHQLSNQLLLKYYWFQVPLCNKTVISCLFGRIVKTMGNQLLVKHYWFQVLLCNKTAILKKVTLHFSFLNISILFLILSNWNIVISFQHFSTYNS